MPDIDWRECALDYDHEDFVGPYLPDFTPWGEVFRQFCGTECMEKRQERDYERWSRGDG